MTNDKRKEAIKMIREADGMLMFSSNSIDETSSAMQIFMEDITPQEVGECFNYILNKHPEIIKYTIFRTNELGDKPIRMN